MWSRDKFLRKIPFSINIHLSALNVVQSSGYAFHSEWFVYGVQCTHDSASRKLHIKFRAHFKLSSWKMAPTQKMLGSVWFYVLVHRPLCTKNTESEKKTTNKQMLPSAWNQIFWIVKQEDHWAALLCFHEQIEVFAKVYFRPSSPLHDSNIISIASHLHYFFVFVCLFSIQHALFGKTYFVCVHTGTSWKARLSISNDSFFICASFPLCALYAHR